MSSRMDEEDEKGRPRVVSEFVRRAIENTMGSVHSTGSLSKDALQYLLQQGDRGKREFVRIVAHEVGEFLRGVNLSSEVIKILTSVQVEFNASVRFKPTETGEIKPEVRAEGGVSLAADTSDLADRAASLPPDPEAPPATPSGS